MLVSSPLSRAHETAQLVGEHFDLQVHKTYPELVERAYGAGEGLDIPSPERRAPERYYPNVESERDVYIRAVRTLRNIVRELSEASGDQKIIAVSHGSFIRRALSAAAGEEWTVTVPNAEPGTWVYAATYLGNSPQTLYGSGWKRLDGNRSFSYETSVSMPAATYRVVVHNGNQGAENAVLGFADMTVERAVTPRQDVSRDEQDATDQLVEELNENPATSTSTAPVPMRNAGGRISTRATDVDASLAALSQSTAPVVNRVQAKAKVQSAQKNLATNLQKADTSAKKAVKAAAGSKNSQNTQGSQNSAAGTKAQGPTIEGTELTGLTKWLVNNANNLLLSAAGLVVLAAALLLRTSMK